MYSTPFLLHAYDPNNFHTILSCRFFDPIKCILVTKWRGNGSHQGTGGSRLESGEFYPSQAVAEGKPILFL